MQDWLQKAVIGLNLCPFAKPSFVQNQIRYVVSSASEAEVLLQQLHDELIQLQKTPPAQIETTLLIHPLLFLDFLDFNHFLDLVESALADWNLEEDFQVASFHPQFQFAGTDSEDIENFTNRAPFPTLHLLRQASLTKALDSVPNPDEIYLRNIEVMRQLGHSGWQKLFSNK